jgi:hypothetical protein
MNRILFFISISFGSPIVIFYQNLFCSFGNEHVDRWMYRQKQVLPCILFMNFPGRMLKDMALTRLLIKSLIH